MDQLLGSFRSASRSSALIAYTDLQPVMRTWRDCALRFPGGACRTHPFRGWRFHGQFCGDCRPGWPIG